MTREEFEDIAQMRAEYKDGRWSSEQDRSFGRPLSLDNAFIQVTLEKFPWESTAEEMSR